MKRNITYELVIGRIDCSSYNMIRVDRSKRSESEDEIMNIANSLTFEDGDCAIIWKRDYVGDYEDCKTIIASFGFGKAVTFAEEFGEEYEYVDVFNDELGYYLNKSGEFYYISGEDEENINIDVSSNNCDVLTHWINYMDIIG